MSCSGQCTGSDRSITASTTLNGGVRANPERKRERGDHGEPGVAAQTAPRVAHVLPKRVEALGSVHSRFLARCRVLESAPRVVRQTEARLGLSPCGIGTAALADELRGAQREVQADLVVHVGSGTIGAPNGEAEQPPDTRPDLTGTHRVCLTPDQRLS